MYNQMTYVLPNSWEVIHDEIRDRLEQIFSLISKEELESNKDLKEKTEEILLTLGSGPRTSNPNEEQDLNTFLEVLGEINKKYKYR